MGHWFNLATAKTSMDCYACGAYHPYRVDGEKNPKFDRHSGFILTSKGAQERNFGQAVKYFADLIMPEVRSWALEGFLPQGTIGDQPFVDVVIVPSSKVGKVSDGLLQVMGKVCARDKRLNLQKNLLSRTKQIEKLATGGNRSRQTHVDSITFNMPPNPASIFLLVDDVCTSGNSLVACCDIIQTHIPHSTVIALTLGKTTHE